MAIPTVIPSIAALKDYVGKLVVASDWVKVTQEQIDTFAEATGDRQWIHVDPERARRESPFKSTVAQGNLTLSLAPALLAKSLIVQGSTSQIHAGFDRVRFPSPVPAGSRLQLTGEITHVRDMPGGGARVSLRLAMKVEGEAKSACIAHSVCVYLP